MDNLPDRARSVPALAAFGALLALVLLLAGALAGVAAHGWLRGPATGPRMANTPVVLREVQGLHQLVTVKYVLEKVVILEDVKWYGGNRLLLVAHGVAKAGVDLGRLTPADIEASGSRVRVRVPRAQLFDVYLDDRHTQVLERTTGLLREFDKDLEQDARRQAVDQIRLAARDAGILKDAEDRAKSQLEALFRRGGYESVEVEFR